MVMSTGYSCKKRTWVALPAPTWGNTSNSKGSGGLFWPPQTPDTHAVHIYTGEILVQIT